MQALGSPPRAGLLSLGTKALFSFIFTAALQSGSPAAACFLPGAAAPDPPPSQSAFHSSEQAFFVPEAPLTLTHHPAKVHSFT